MTKTLTATISKVNEMLFKGDAVSVSVPGVDGEMTILPQHEALITPLKKGMVIVRTEEGEEVFAIETGICEISANQVTVLI